MFGQDRAVADWVSAQKFGVPFTRLHSAIGVVQNGRLTGGFVFSCHSGTTIDLSLAGRGVLRPVCNWSEILNHVYGAIGCVRMQCYTSMANKMVRKCLPHLGFRFEGKARRFYGKEDGLCFSLTVDDLPKFRARWSI